jgi:N-acetylmuramic acid 6-phosphate etherase
MGGWGHWLGDKGSGYEIGMRALKACVYYYDRDNVWPRLGSAILRVLQLNEPEDLIGWVQAAQKHEIAALAVEVFDAWKRRDKIASDILHGAAASLGKDGASCAKRLVRPGSRVQFILAGSVLVKQAKFGKLVSTELVKHWPHCEITSLREEGAMGAVRLAQLEWGGGAAGQARGQGMRAGGSRAAASTTSVASAHKSTHSETLEAAGLIPKGTQLSPTEQRNPRSIGLDKLPLDKAVALMLTEEAQVTGVLGRQLPAITRCIRMIVRAFRQGGRLFYVGAGTSGRLGVLDASECPPTFRVSPEQVQGIIAGGQQALWQSFEGAEDDFPAGARAVEFRGVTAQDLVVGIAASGRTPFVWGALAAARRAGARTAFVCFNPHLQISREQRPNVLLAFDLGPEVLTGSTRLKAGTATKLLLNLFTTLSMVRMSKVVSNLMVDVNPSNEKLRERAIRIVRELTSVSGPDAAQALEEAGWVVKQALERLKRTKKTRGGPPVDCC